jgi:hypothetical protein
VAAHQEGVAPVAVGHRAEAQVRLAGQPRHFRGNASQGGFELINLAGEVRVVIDHAGGDRARRRDWLHLGLRRWEHRRGRRTAGGIGKPAGLGAQRRRGGARRRRCGRFGRARFVQAVAVFGASARKLLASRSARQLARLNRPRSAPPKGPGSLAPCAPPASAPVSGPARASAWDPARRRQPAAREPPLCLRRAAAARAAREQVCARDGSSSGHPGLWWRLIRPPGNGRVNFFASV